MKPGELINIKQKLPMTPSIMGREEYFNSAVLIPLIEMNGELHFLFEKRAENIRQGSEICFPGGAIDPGDESAEKTAARETEEEIGIKREKIITIGRLDTLIGHKNILIDSYIAQLLIKSLEECTLDKTEVEKVFTVPVSFFENNEPEKFKVVSEFNYTFYNSRGEVEDLIPSKRKSMNHHIDDSYSKITRHVLVYKYNGEVIWGITARLIYEFIKILNGSK